MGVFEFIILIVLITSITKAVSERGQRAAPPPRDETRLPPGELRELRETLERMDERLARIEEERDFYRALLDDPRRRGELSSPQEPGEPG